MSSVAVFLALTTGGAYAANEWTGANVQDESLTGADIRGKSGSSTVAGVNGSLTGHAISGQAANPATGQAAVPGSLTTWDVADGSLRGSDLATASVGSEDLAAGSAKTVVARLRHTRPVNLMDGTVLDFSWEQPATETHMLVGEFDFTEPAPGSCGQARIRLSLDDRPAYPVLGQLGYAFGPDSDTSSTKQTKVPLGPAEGGDRYIFEPGVKRTRRLVLGGGALNCTSLMIDAIRINVVAIR